MLEKELTTVRESSQADAVRRLLCWSLVALSIAMPQLLRAEEGAPAEKIRDKSPDGKFAMRISYKGEENKQLIDGENADEEKIFSETITAIELVSLPAKQVVAKLMSENDLGEGYNYGDITLVWSSDSKWCAYYWSFPRVGYTTVYHLRGDKFVAVNEPEALRTDVKGDVRNEYIKPLHWTRPGVLILDQMSIFRGENASDSDLQLTAALDPRSGKFKVVSKKKAPPQKDN